MKNAVKTIIVIVCTAALMLASAVSAFAIGFDAEEIYDSVFVILSGDSLGSGFAMGKNCIVTNAHVIEDSANTRIETYDGSCYDAFVIAMDEDLDIAVLGVEGKSFTPLKVADLSEVSIGDDVCAIGAPDSLAYTLTKGVVSAKDRQVGGQSYIQTDAAINHGNSGGPLLTDSGEIIGVNSYKVSDNEGIGLAIPISVVTKYLEDCGITLNSDGNVASTVTDGDTDKPAETPKPAEKPHAPAHKSGVNSTALVLGAVLGAVVIVSVVIIIVLVKRKKKQAELPSDPSERTDFEIDILE